MITISFLEEIDGEPTSTPQNELILAARRCPSVNELGPRGPEYFMPRDALNCDMLAREQVGLQLVDAAAYDKMQAKKNPPSFSVIVNGRLLEQMKAEDGEFDSIHFAA